MAGQHTEGVRGWVISTRSVGVGVILKECGNIEKAWYVGMCVVSRGCVMLRGYVSTFQNVAMVR